MDLGLTGKVALITGGSYGIGRASAISMGREGAHVAICARRGEVLEEAAIEVREKTGHRCFPYKPTSLRPRTSSAPSNRPSTTSAGWTSW